MTVKAILESADASDFHPVRFTVDAALLRELGERLVGRPEIALAELVKNAYDADARACIITFEDNAIEIVDDGHGMSEREFKDFWMRVGTTVKQRENISRRMKRPVTGSKGVGRLAVQFLATELELSTSSDEDPTRMLQAYINWGEAQAAKHLTEAHAMYRVTPREEEFANRSIHGTRIRLSGIRERWNSDSIRELAQELWFLQPPYKDSESEADPKAFNVSVVTQDENLADVFNEQMNAALNNWQARITGRVVDGRNTGTVHVAVDFKDGDSWIESFVITDKEIPKCSIDNVEFEILVFKLTGRQSHGVTVFDARKYFKQFGGVHVYDSGFRLPYYGVEQDWLGIEMDHSHRLHRSALLPDNLQVFRGLQDLPTLGRIYGVVKISTSREAEVAKGFGDNTQYLVPQISRDRLVDNEAYRLLQRAVRISVDYYATRVRVRRTREWDEIQRYSPPIEKIGRVQAVLESFHQEIPEPVYVELRTRVGEAVEAEKAAQRSSDEEKSLLGALASAGMVSIALEHEIGKELTELDRLIGVLESSLGDLSPTLAQTIDALKQWSERVKETRKIFSHLMNEDDRQIKTVTKASVIIDSIARNMGALLRDIDVDVTGVPRDLLLPKASMAEWNAIFQNLFTNSVNAMLSSQDRRIVCTGQRDGDYASIIVSDTGVGVDWIDSEKLFKPFERELEIPEDRKSLGFGGVGLGLTIVRLIADTIGCSTSFVKPDHPYSTSFKLSWEIKQNDH